MNAAALLLIAALLTACGGSDDNEPEAEHSTIEQPQCAASGVCS